MCVTFCQQLNLLFLTWMPDNVCAKLVVMKCNNFLSPTEIKKKIDYHIENTVRTVCVNTTSILRIRQNRKNAMKNYGKERNSFIFCCELFFFQKGKVLNDWHSKRKTYLHWISISTEILDSNFARKGMGTSILSANKHESEEQKGRKKRSSKGIDY